MGKKKVMLPASEVDTTTLKYAPQRIQGPHLTGFRLKLLVTGSRIMSFFKNKNRESEPGVLRLEEDGKSEERVELALQCLPDNNPGCIQITDPRAPFSCWKIRDYAYAYRSKLTTPSQVAEHFISAVEEFNNNNPRAPLLSSYDPDEVRRQAAASTQRFEEVGFVQEVNYQSWMLSLWKLRMTLISIHIHQRVKQLGFTSFMR